MAPATLTRNPGHQLQGPQHAHSPQRPQVEVGARSGEDPVGAEEGAGSPLRGGGTPLPPPARSLPEQWRPVLSPLPQLRAGTGGEAGAELRVLPRMPAAGFPSTATLRSRGIASERTPGLWPPPGLVCPEDEPKLNRVPEQPQVHSNLPQEARCVRAQEGNRAGGARTGTRSCPSSPYLRGTWA